MGGGVLSNAARGSSTSAVYRIARFVTTERQARLLLERVNHLRQLVAEIECDCTEWQCDADLRRTFARMKVHLDDATLALALLQPLKKH